MYEINLQSAEPVYAQIVRMILSRIIGHLLKAGDQLPSVRQFSVDTGINPNTVAKAYKELEREKIISSISGKGTFVNEVDLDRVKDMVFREFDETVTSMVSMGLTREELIQRIKETGVRK